MNKLLWYSSNSFYLHCLYREQQETIPVMVNYSLTSKGKELAVIINQIIAKSDSWNKSTNNDNSM
ncbi:winged helix-turn-helix transcriptional regulator [Photobacterium indicum]|uniref:winged helix-turn-helix transcriptional regulator n=1 Tax=Photobacterium indicum TaxID=81447 RepID=UPI003D10308C